MRTLPSNTLAYPVYVELTPKPNAVIHGSGFFINTVESTVFVTATHTLIKEGAFVSRRATLTSYPATLGGKRNIFKVDLNTLNEHGHVVAHDAHDVAVMLMGARSLSGTLTLATGIDVEESDLRNLSGIDEANVKLL